MYRYDEFDHLIVRERIAQYRDQVQRRLAGALTEDEFRILRLQNGLYMQRHAYMFRIAIPYGLLTSDRLRKLAYVARTYDRGYGHFTTRQNMQFNWINLEDTPDILEELAKVEMHSIQTSGNCMRNITSDPFAGVAPDECTDPRPWAEILRHWTTFHPEFAYLPRKFKIAVNAAQNDRTAVAIHDIGLHLVRDAAGLLGFEVWVGGGLGRTPILASKIRAFVPWQDIMTYLEAILRVYNQYGRRDNIFKARIKILVKALGVEAFTRAVEEEWADLQGGAATLTEEEVARVQSYFDAPPYATLPDTPAEYLTALRESRPFSNWVKRNVKAHKVPGYASVVVSLKKPGVPPGDVSAEQMELLADLAERYSFAEARVTHEQNLVLADVRQSDLHAVWHALKAQGMATPNIGLLTDLICCPGGDFCALANAKSIPIALDITDRFNDLDYLHDIGEIELNMSGCINACGHHHVGNIGILGVDKDGSEWYQVSIGGAQGREAAIGKIIGPSFAAGQMPDVVERIIQVYLRERVHGERFIDTVDRIGIAPFKEEVYGTPLKSFTHHGEDAGAAVVY